ncbi:probable ribosome biogenesis protein RLP24 [Caerostris darwini]|uniref:Probable ribosome biogenesis protein RLP24 n=1 Tax=Caerostris darwini TaxID=1538125 RepID=A0AAV4Q8A3_9ARAC|nr:probable ribosome biogenesis protein RLP24 [Caerostris darwini]
MRVERCYFCSSPLYPGHGIQLIRNDNKIFRFCRSKCRKMFNRKKNPRKLKWTKAFRKAAGKELTVDPIFEFEKHRHEPAQYNRELWQKSIDAMKKVSDIRKKREATFINRRLKVGKVLAKEQDYKEVQEDLCMIRSVAAKGNKMKLDSKEINLDALREKIKQRKLEKKIQQQDEDVNMDLSIVEEKIKQRKQKKKMQQEAEVNMDSMEEDEPERLLEEN